MIKYNCKFNVNNFFFSVVSNEPKTYATLVKSGGNSGSVSFASAAMATSPNQISKPSNSPVSTTEIIK